MEPLRVSESQVTWTEEKIDSFNADLGSLDSFVLPGGSPASAHLHHARTVVRRAERDMTEIAYQEPVNPAALRYVNRLSDLLFASTTSPAAIYTALSAIRAMRSRPATARAKPATRSRSPSGCQKRVR